MCKQYRFYCRTCRKANGEITLHCSESTTTDDLRIQGVTGPNQRVVCANFTTDYAESTDDCYDCRERTRQARIDAGHARRMADSPPPGWR